MNAIKSIQQMKVGDYGTIIRMDQIDRQRMHRFMDLGIAPQASIILLKKMNFDHLYIVDVDDVEICIRKQDASHIFVQI